MTAMYCLNMLAHTLIEARAVNLAAQDLEAQVENKRCGNSQTQVPLMLRFEANEMPSRRCLSLQPAAWEVPRSWIG